MDNDKKMAIALPVIFTIGIVFMLSYLPNSYSVSSERQGPQCGTTYKIVFNDPSKFDESKILDTLKENLSGVDFSDVLGSKPWWQYMHVTVPDSQGVSSLTVPTYFSNSNNAVFKTIQEINGVSKVDHAIESWCA